MLCIINASVKLCSNRFEWPSVVLYMLGRPQVGALLFKSWIQETKTVTDLPAYWMMPTDVDKVYTEVDYKTDSSSGTAKKKKKAHGKCICVEN